jgi:hypothetical protein
MHTVERLSGLDSLFRSPTRPAGRRNAAGDHGPVSAVERVTLTARDLVAAWTASRRSGGDVDVPFATPGSDRRS